MVLRLRQDKEEEKEKKGEKVGKRTSLRQAAKRRGRVLPFSANRNEGALPFVFLKKVEGGEEGRGSRE